MISFICPHCQKKYQGEDGYSGKEVQCPNCQNKFTIIQNDITDGSIQANKYGPKKRLIIIIFAVLILVLIGLFGSEYYKEWSFKKALRAPVNLERCIDMTKKLRACEAFTCEHDAVTPLIYGKMHNIYSISGTNGNCSLNVETTVDKKPFTNMVCTNLTSLDAEDLAYDYDIMFTSTGSSFSTNFDITGKSNTTIGDKVLKNALNKLFMDRKCSV